MDDPVQQQQQHQQQQSIPTSPQSNVVENSNIQSFASSPSNSSAYFGSVPASAGSMTPNYSITSSNSQIPPPSSSSTTTAAAVTQSNNNNSFESILESWRVFNVEKKKSDLGDLITQIGGLKEDCLKSRKVLAKQTQDFKKVADEEKIKNFGSLLKLYQDEVDKLTKRSKFSETCFLGVYKDLNEITDPVPALTAALEEYSKVDITTKLEIENKKLLTELNEFKKEFQEIQNQEVTIRRLEDKIKEYENRFESSALEKVGIREQELRQEFSEKINLIKAREQELSRTNALLQEELNKLTIAHSQSESLLLDTKNKYEDELNIKQSEIDMLTTDFERISSTLSSIQKENLSSREESMKPLVQRVARLEYELIASGASTAKNLETISELTQQLASERESSVSFQRQLEIEREKVDKLDTHIQNNPSPADYENIKKELATLQAIVGSDEISNHPNSDQKNVFKEKNRQLENECTKLRLIVSEYETDIIKKNYDIDKLIQIKDEQYALIQKLEEDLSIKGQMDNNMMMGGNVGVHPSLISSSNNLRLSNDITELLPNNSLTLSPIVNNNNNNNNNNTNSLNNSSLTTNDLHTNSGIKDDKMLDIVTSQRDRLKLQVKDLEVEKSKLLKEVEKNTMEISSLKNDNIKLYEKIRFLQSYDKNRTNSNKRNNIDKNFDIESGLNNNSNNNNNDFNNNSGSNNSNNNYNEEKYGKLYEESINPFLSFNKKEKYRRYREMNTAERVIFNGSRFFLSNKYSRLFLFIYSIFLHFLVFFTLYRLATITTEQHIEGFNNNNNVIPQVTPLLPSQKEDGGDAGALDSLFSSSISDT
ncbi:hypothetical protein CYY_008818 [Polysphondylium violaceum]|uniref:Protein CASP n=1 Tax=Polysphondylium violaceum TaxID=133409 RepID=A0A8J4PL07_9MYCE|nr:hypothetical protein CYY_008818 [Polysphondylium violaceum]